MAPQLNERQRRLYAGTLASTCGQGGLKVVHEVTGMSENTIRTGQRELKGDGSSSDRGTDDSSSSDRGRDSNTSIEKGRIRRKGGGPKYTIEKQPNIEEMIGKIVDGKTQGDPMRPLSHTTESPGTIARKLSEEYKINISHDTTGTILRTMGYSRQSNQKMLQLGKAHPDRNEQFEFIDAEAKEFISEGQPVISVDTRKKENIGNFKNNGKEYRPSGNPRKVLDHDFPIEELGKVAPYGVYNLNSNTGFVNLGDRL
jgi:hypothetical protein